MSATQPLPADFALVEPERKAGVLLDAKTRATWTAMGCLRGVVLHFLKDDSDALLIVASKGSQTAQLHSTAEVEEFLQRVGEDQS